LRVTPDTNILVRAHPRSRSTGRKLIVALIEGGHTLVLSNEIVAETVAVLRYPRLQKRFALSDEELYDYSQFLRQVSQTVILSQPFLAPLRDPDDLHVLETAERGAAEVLCTNDADFHDPAMLAYCAARGIEVCNENTLLARLSPGYRKAR
jgi:putative PIN family toxin of toxin-antitoxin system